MTYALYGEERDQVIRPIDFGLGHAGTDNLRDQDLGPPGSYVIALQHGGVQTNSEEIVDRYWGNPGAIERALLYREDFTKADCARLTSSLVSVRWRDPLILYVRCVGESDPGTPGQPHGH